MPKSKQNFVGLLDSWGRRNRKLNDKQCESCGKTFRPARTAARFCSRPCMWSKNGGHNKKQVSWWVNTKGYIEGRIWIDEETQIYVKQHRFIMEGILGRPLLPSEDVHHIDGNKANNDPSNLEVIDHGKHSTYTNKSRKHRKGYKLNISAEERYARSMRAISTRLSHQGRAAIAKAEGGGK